ncbi:MAG: LuxR C-terminal-related transcriptional regulator [Clostridia bacterium]|nr:LuxR C-terminal-related transcriptional regulator [Clostridia bacterium]
MAKKLFISVGTTKWHINNIFSKLKLKRRSQAVAYYHEINKET